MKVDYQKTIIYKLCCRDVNVKEIYVGHTTNFKLRNNDHKHNCNNPNSKAYNHYKYKFIRDNGGYENWVMIKIKDYPCNNKRDAEAEENRIMIQLGATLNSIKSYTTEEEKKEQKIKCDKKYYKKNKHILNEYQKNYYELNKDEILKQQKDYYEINKSMINEKITCELCGAMVSKKYLKDHQKRNKCKRKSECMILDDD